MIFLVSVSANMVGEKEDQKKTSNELRMGSGPWVLWSRTRWFKALWVLFFGFLGSGHGVLVWLRVSVCVYFLAPGQFD